MLKRTRGLLSWEGMALPSRCGWSPEPVHPPRQNRVTPTERGSVLMIVPGVADKRRALMVLQNIQSLRPTTCVIFTHRVCGDDVELDEMLDAHPPWEQNAMLHVTARWGAG